MIRPASISITVLLVTAIGGLVAFAVGAVLLLSAYANFKNTSELVLDSAEAFMESLEADVKVHSGARIGDCRVSGAAGCRWEA